LDTNPYSAPQANLEGNKQADPSPAIWNPGAAAKWSLLFSPIFGALLHMKNWEALGKPEKAAASRQWAIGCAIFYFVIVMAGIFVQESKGYETLERGACLGLLIGWYMASAKDQMDFVAYGYGKDYVRRGWGKPMLFAVLACVGVMVLVFVVALIANAFGLEPTGT
jgi:hypothetical protein